MSSWTVTIFGACTRHAYKPLFENLPAWRFRDGKFRVFSVFFGENHVNPRRSPVKFRRERTACHRRPFQPASPRASLAVRRGPGTRPGGLRWPGSGGGGEGWGAGGRGVKCGRTPNVVGGPRP